MNVRVSLAQAQTIRILFPQEVRLEEMREACTLALALRRQGKQLRLQGGVTSSLFSEALAPDQKTCVVSLKGLAPWVSRVRYEKTSTDIRLFFELQQGEVSPKDVSLDMPFSEDLSVIVGNREGGDKKDPSVTELLSAALEQVLPTEQGNLALAGRILAGTKRNLSPAFYTSTLSARDFAETKTSSKALPLLIQEAASCLRAPVSLLLAYESNSGTRGLLWSAEDAVVSRVLSLGSGERRGAWTLLTLPHSLDALKEKLA